MLKNNLFILILIIIVPCITYAQNLERSLDYYLQTAISGNPSIKDIRNQQMALKYDSLLVRISSRPKISADGILLTAPVINGYGYDEAITNGNTFSAVVSFSQDLLVWKANKKAYENISIQNRSLQVNSKLTGKELKRNITAQYILAWASSKEIDFDKEMLDLLLKQSGIVNKLATQGLYNKTDYLTLKIEIQNQQMNIKQLSMDYFQNLYELDRLCGINDTNYYTLAEPEIKPIYNPVSGQSPFFDQFYIDSLKTLNEIEIIKLQYKPKLNWFADAGLNNTNPSYIHKNFGISAGLNFTIPLNSGQQKKLEIAKYSLAEDTRTDYKNFFSQQYKIQVYQIRKQISQYDSLIIISDRQIEQYKELITADELLINSGSISIMDYINVLKNYIEFKRNDSALKTKRLLMMNDLEYWLSN